LAVGLVVVAACAPPAGAPSEFVLPPGVTSVSGNYGAASTSYTLLSNGHRSDERLVVFVHGGAWQTGSKDLFPSSVKRLVNQGYSVASIAYPLSISQRHREQVRHVKDALSYFKANEAALGIDGESPILVGFSAGGHLAALAGTTSGVAGYAPHGAATENLPGALVLLTAPVDLALLNATAPSGLAAGANASAMSVYLNNSCPVIPNNPGCDTPLAEASPTTHLNAGDPPIYTVGSVHDERIPLSQQSRLIEVAGADVHVQQVLLASSTTVSECIEYSNATGCDSNAWVHSAVPTQLNTNNLAIWLNSRGLAA